jgi:hypothetical protein
MPRQLSLRTTVVLVSLLFSVGFSLQLLGRPSAPKAAVRAAPKPLVDRPGAAPEVALSAATRVPALRDPRKPKPKPRPKPKPKPKRHKVVVAPKPAAVQRVPTPARTPVPTATAAPAPAPRYVPPARTPAPTPKATPAPSGSFDTSGTG